LPPVAPRSVFPTVSVMLSLSWAHGVG
jgi:hypothetical protein